MVKVVTKVILELAKEAGLNECVRGSLDTRFALGTDQYKPAEEGGSLPGRQKSPLLPRQVRWALKGISVEL